MESIEGSNVAWQKKVKDRQTKVVSGNGRRMPIINIDLYDFTTLINTHASTATKNLGVLILGGRNQVNIWQQLVNELS